MFIIGSVPNFRIRFWRCGWQTHFTYAENVLQKWISMSVSLFHTCSPLSFHRNHILSLALVSEFLDHVIDNFSLHFLLNANVWGFHFQTCKQYYSTGVLCAVFRDIFFVWTKIAKWISNTLNHELTFAFDFWDCVRRRERERARACDKLIRSMWNGIQTPPPPRHLLL